LINLLPVIASVCIIIAFTKALDYYSSKRSAKKYGTFGALIFYLVSLLNVYSGFFLAVKYIKVI
jgi:hypothetical protein